MTYEERMNELSELRAQIDALKAERRAALEAEMHKPEPAKEPEPPKPELTVGERLVMELLNREQEARNQMSGALRRRLDENKTADIFWRRGQLN